MHQRIAWINNYIIVPDKRKENVQMSSRTYEGIRIYCPSEMQALPTPTFIKNLLIMQNLPRKLKNSESNKNLGVKKNTNLYIYLQTIFPKRRCL